MSLESGVVVKIQDKVGTVCMEACLGQFWLVAIAMCDLQWYTLSNTMQIICLTNIWDVHSDRVVWKVLKQAHTEELISQPEPI